MTRHRFNEPTARLFDAATWDRVDEWGEASFADLADMGSRLTCADHGEHGVGLVEAPVAWHAGDDSLVDDRATHGWVTCGCGARFPSGDALRLHAQVHR